ncbi:MAG TPA: biotin--[acetyl-CoA-carboxylase] ligase [Bdellovibrionales bacterium]|nr:MAG: biotin--[acetyl-CoA-carboxylase] ligase [Bdellovibrionales bacterium GWB1_52_6]OFZ04932.1 MAG: biotin--[acetyl-CoA-carboxylase] ligase [Bdellovibrionales bacterium GWA1_52_35]OFZ34622.1 MAG: biotin--[acetyl-CoA-carboxylase] ligase [Bdellovibrionales bacterium GWC1_52_8]HAR41485.1 biotin--[acetyl-CoA-carboxylase] ligase [Bdellovibrionales bacterium]HCM38869.1 biotin--[acetyl-CoA-carboxylase] ligase [Bdellovibrionales bacterium]
MTKPRAFNQVIDRCASTNDTVRELGEMSYPHGTWISARVQEAGRGRLGHSWESLEGNLFLSILLRPSETKFLSWLPLAVAVGMTRALDLKFPSLGVRIKWPNDIWIGSRKLAGILCEARATTGSRGEFFVIAGVGLNCVSAPADAISISEKLGETVTADQVRADVLAEILRTTDQLFSSGPEFVKVEYAAKALFKTGTLIEWSGGNSGAVVGLGSSGELLVSTVAGVQGLFAEDVRATRSRG